MPADFDYAHEGCTTSMVESSTAHAIEYPDDIAFDKTSSKTRKGRKCRVEIEDAADMGGICQHNGDLGLLLKSL